MSTAGYIETIVGLISLFGFAFAMYIIWPDPPKRKPKKEVKSKPDIINLKRKLDL
jgi:hypothetical protein